jgi:hypothetical protein
VHVNSFFTLFSAKQTLIFNRQAAPIKGRPKLPRVEVPKHISNYASKSLQKLYTPTPKRPAADMEIEIHDETVPNVTPIPVTRHTLVQDSRRQPVQATLKESTGLQELQQALQSNGSSLKKLEMCCSTLAETINKSAIQMQTMNSNFNQRFNDLASTVDKLANSPSRYQQKHHKDNHGALDKNQR